MHDLIGFTIYGVCLFIVVVLFTLIFKWFWNFTIPRLAESISPTYNRLNDFSPIDFRTALGLTLLLSLGFGGLNACPGTLILTDNLDKFRCMWSYTI